MRNRRPDGFTKPIGSFFSGSQRCLERLHTYGRRCELDATPHQLRHSCATLLLNAGAPVLTVQALLGHKFVDTTLDYAHLYDGTIAADYYRAMAQVEKQLDLQPGAKVPTSLAHLLATRRELRPLSLKVFAVALFRQEEEEYLVGHER